VEYVDFSKGAEASLPVEDAMALVEQGVAEVVQDESELVEPKPKRKPKGYNVKAEFEVADAAWFRELLSTLGRMVEDLPLVVKRDGLHFTFMDPARIAMWDGHISIYDFAEYRCVRQGRRTLPLKNILDTALKRVGKETRLRFLIDGRKDSVTLTLRDTALRKYSFYLLDFFGKDTPVPKIRLKARYKLALKGFHSDLKRFNEAKCNEVIFSGNRRKFTARSSRSDYCLREVEVTYNLEDETTLLEAKVSKISRARYSLALLLDALNPKLGEAVTLSYSTDMPLKVSYDMLAAPNSRLEAWLAPRIEVE